MILAWASPFNVRQTISTILALPSKHETLDPMLFWCQAVIKDGGPTTKFVCFVFSDNASPSGNTSEVIVLRSSHFIHYSEKCHHNAYKLITIKLSDNNVTVYVS